MAPRRRCPVCASKEWHKEPQSGLITCSEGHVLQNYRNETREVNELGPHTVRKRTLKSGRKRQEKHSKADPKLYHGERARYHYFQCLQLILRLQVAALTRMWQLPPEFEKLCRELWALNLSLLPNPPVAEPLLNIRDGKGADSLSRNEATARRKSLERGAGDGDERDEGFKSGTTSSSSSDESSDGESSDGDSELEQLMRENSESPSSDDEDHSPKDRTSVPVKMWRHTFGRYDAPASTMSVLVLACWTLRLPVMYMDFVKIIQSYDLPYLDALRLLPENMVRHLRKQTAQALSPHHTPTPLHLHNLSSRLAKLLYASFGVYTPEMNAAPILWKAVHSLQGSPTLYAMTKRLASVISIPLTLHRSLAPELVRTKKKDPSFHKHDSAIPEVALVAAVIVVMKMVYGLDSKPRQPRDKCDPACALPCLTELLEAIKEAEASDLKRTPVSSLDINLSVLDMDGKMLDDYLQFCEKALLPREDRMPPRNAAIDKVPLLRAYSPASSERTNDICQEPVEPRREGWTANAMSEDDAPRSGEQYTIYNTQDILGTLPDDMELVVSRAARWAGVDEGYLSGVVERFERRVVRWWDGSRKKTSKENATGYDPE